MFNQLAKDIYEGNAARGFWDLAKSNDEPVVKATKIALIHSEASEMLEAVRKPSETQLTETIKVSNEAEELADIMIRCLDYAGYFKIDLDGIIQAKLIKNATRGHKHGGKVF